MNIRIGKKFGAIIKAYGDQFGMTQVEMATFLLKRAVDDINRSNAIEVMRRARGVNRSNVRGG